MGAAGHLLTYAKLGNAHLRNLCTAAKLRIA
jgi:hypothetical protein